MNIKTSKGFTMIELLVVVAIIAVLAGIVLTNTTQYINKGKDSSIKGNLSSIATNAAFWYDDATAFTPHTAGSYTGFTASTGATVPASAANTASGGTVTYGVPTATAWCACSPTKVVSTSVFCVDSTGVKKMATLTNCATECAAAVCV